MKRQNSTWLFTRMAFQNLLRRPTRTLMLVLAVAVGTGAVLASYTVARGIEASMQQRFARMGADLIVVPQETMVNITSALLTVQPTEESLAPEVLETIAKLDGVEQAAPQTIYRVPVMAGMPDHKVNLIAFDPERDFTVIPWMVQHLPRPLQKGELICGSRCDEAMGEEIQPCNVPAVIYGKLGRSGVGPFDESLFATYDTVAGIVPNHHRNLSAVLVRLQFGATPEQVRFAISRIPGVKVITGSTIVTSTRQPIAALLGGMMAFTVMMLMSSLILISLLFSGIISERQRELGLLRAIGTRRADTVQMLMVEGVLATGIGGVCGVLLGCGLMLMFQHSLVYKLEMLHVPFAWPPMDEIGVTAILCALLAAFVGLIGSLLPAWNVTGKEAYLLIQGEGF